MFLKFCQFKGDPAQIVEEWKSQTMLFSFFVSILDDETVVSDSEVFEKLESFIDWYNWEKIGLDKKFFTSFIERNWQESFSYFSKNRHNGTTAFAFSSDELKAIIENTPEVKEYLLGRGR